MKNNYMIIGNRKDTALAKTNPVLKEIPEVSRIDAKTGEVMTNGLVYEKEWGNDSLVTNRLDGKLLADRRLYARALYIQQIKCNTVLESLGSVPAELKEPFKFTVIDVSVGGIGIVCENEVLIGTVLYFQLLLDNIPYDIKCEVVYCFQNDGSCRAGLRILDRDRKFIKHLKIFVARLTLQAKYGSGA